MQFDYGGLSVRRALFAWPPLSAQRGSISHAARADMGRKGDGRKPCAALEAMRARAENAAWHSPRAPRPTAGLPPRSTP